MGGALAMKLALLGVLLAADARGQGGAGERLYREGALPSGKPLRGVREAGVGVEGLAAACATCHRRSGLGSWEGQIVMPPITGAFLARAGSHNVDEHATSRGAYTDASLARAIRDGVDPQGRMLTWLMPRYRLDDATMATLVGYLHSLGSAAEPGVEFDTLHFATITTPDADPIARRATLDVLQQFFADKNAGYRGESRPLQSTRGVMYRVSRKWQLHVWELTGAPDTWDAQLQAHQTQTPVFAVISGVGGRTWAPIHRFCEREALPCLFPNVDGPPVAEKDVYPIYFSRGVGLEAQLIARQLKGRPGRVVQVFRDGDLGEDAAKALEAAAPTLRFSSRRLGPGTLTQALADVGAQDALVLWLRPGDLAGLPAPPTQTVFVSGLLGGLEHAPLNAAWRAVARLSYPFDLPEARQVRMNFPLGWFNVRHLAVVDERVQTDTYLACAILSEALGHMQESFVRDLLIERVESMVEHRLVNGYYPRLGLAPGQRFASKGGSFVRFAQADGPRVEPVGGWIVP